MESKIVLITGSTDGIGKQAALELAGMGATVLLHGRSPDKGRAASDEIRKATANANVDYFNADLSSQRQVRALAEQVQQKYDRLHALINNAGVYMKRRELTEDGLEMTFAVNHLAPFLLTHLLLDLMKKSAPARVVNVSSTTHQSGRADFGNLQGEKKYDGYSAYALSKLGNVLFTYELAERLAQAGAGVTANCLHPGVIGTKLLRAGWGGGGASLREGAETIVYLAGSPEVEGVTGKYFVKKKPTRSAALTYDKALQTRFWEVSAELAGLNEPSPTRTRPDFGMAGP